MDTPLMALRMLLNNMASVYYLPFALNSLFMLVPPFSWRGAIRNETLTPSASSRRPMRSLCSFLAFLTPVQL